VIYPKQLARPNFNLIFASFSQEIDQKEKQKESLKNVEYKKMINM